jgi:iron uptake system component EfeO
MTDRALRAPSLAALAAAAATLVVLTGCVPNAPAASSNVTVSSSDESCELSTTSAPAGSIVFTITNSGDDVTEFYLLGADGLRVVSELENIGPGVTRDLVVQVPAGDYVTACKPGMVGDGLRGDFTVLDTGIAVTPSGEHAEQLQAAADQYLLYVRDQIQSLQFKTEAFIAAYEAGDDDAARDLYADARVHWERIEPVAESFGDLDPSMDAREADLGPHEEWTGWHHIEKNLWPPAEGYELNPEQRGALAARLLADTDELARRVRAEDFRIDAFQIGNGAKELLDEVVAGKITGEEEIWSHTDLWDFQANVDGALVAFEVLRPVLEQSDAALAAELEDRFANLNELLSRYGSIDEGFVYYDELTPEQVLELSRAVDALAEPLSRLTAATVL